MFMIFNLESYQSQKDIWEEPSLTDNENYVPMLFYMGRKRYLLKSEFLNCDNFDNIILEN